MTEIRETSGTGIAGGKFLTFELEGERYGLPILAVREIVGVLPVTRVPRTPPHVLGIINLRGKIVPVVDTRARFGMKPRETDPQTSIVVLDSGDAGVGIVVDRVSDVTDIDGAQIEPAPDLGGECSRNRFVVAIAHAEDTVVLILNMDGVVSAADRDVSPVVEVGV